MLKWILNLQSGTQIQTTTERNWIHKSTVLIIWLLITLSLWLWTAQNGAEIGHAELIFISWITVIYMVMGHCLVTNRMRPYEFLYLIYIPLLLSGMAAGDILYNLGKNVSPYHVIFLLCIGIYPFLRILDIYLSIFRVGILQFIWNGALAYNIGFFLLLTINYLCLSFWLQLRGFGGFTDFFNSAINNIITIDIFFWELVLVYIGTLLLVIFPILTLIALHRVTFSRKILWLGFIFAIVIAWINFASARPDDGWYSSNLKKNIDTEMSNVERGLENIDNHPRKTFWATWLFTSNKTKYINLPSELNLGSIVVLLIYFVEISSCIILVVTLTRWYRLEGNTDNQKYEI